MRKLECALALFSLLVLAACNGQPGKPGSGSGSGGEEPQALLKASPSGDEAPAQTRSFPTLTVPSIYGEGSDEAKDYVLEHYWDAFFKGDGKTGPDTVLGIADGNVEQALANYIQILATVKSMATPDDMEPLKKAQNSVKRFFRKLEARQKADTTALTYLRLTEIVARYLYDPNSPMRDEDLYLPFVEAMADSPCTRDDLRTACRHELQMCRTNPFGSKAPDFSFSRIDGSKGRLYGVKAEYTMLFFSNPGCESCKEIIRDVMSRDYVESYIASGRLAIVNIYVDEEINAWRDYHHNYPSSWINGYDYTFSLRDSWKYDIRAIPSLYLLDSGKRVLMKDAPTEKVLSFLDNI
ncbi:MAG: DUF5106 domain-containing protein [Bacteroidales bacterium]|nr:DUF5106 domain-containing protein [Bacteroidales bacterium]